MTDAFVNRSSEQHQQYLGDAVYASFDGYQVWLRTGDGSNNQIALEPAVMHRLFEYVEDLKRHYNPTSPTDGD